MKFKNLVVLALVGLATVASTNSAQAARLSVLGALSTTQSGWGLESSPMPLVGGELTFGIGDYFQLGGFFENNFISFQGGSGLTSSVQFYGAVVRISAITGLYLDAKAGFDKGEGSDTGVGIGAGLGYRIPLGFFADISPRVGYRYLPYSYAGVSGNFSRSTLDFGLLLELKLF